MKKLPIIMSALALFAGTSGMTMAKNVLAETSVSKADVLHTEANIYDWGGLLLTQIDPKENHLIFYPAGAVDDCDTLRFVFAYQNYEAGVLKSEADASLGNLGIVDDGNFVILHDQDVRNQPQSPEWLIRPQQKLFDNKTDRIYYAIEHGERVADGDGEVSWKNVWWERGEIDYRSCIHSTKYSYNTTVCNQIFRDDAEMREFDYLVASNKDGELLSQFGTEDIISWEDEWLQIQQERVEGVRKDLVNVQDVVTNLGAYLNNAESTLDRLDVTLAVTGNAEGMLAQVSELRDILNELREWLRSHDVSEMNLELEVLQKELARLKDEYEILRKEKEELSLWLDSRDEEIKRLELELRDMKSEKEQLMEEKRELEEQLAQRTEQDSQAGQADDDRSEQGNLTNQVGGLEVVKQEGQIKQNFTSKTEDIEVDTQESKGIVARFETETEGNANEEGVKEATVTAEIPLLGETDTKSNFWWIVPGATLVGLTGLFLVRKRRNN